MNLKPSSLQLWFFTVLWLNVMDILLTIPVYESNPFTLYMWETMGISVSAGIKIAQVLSLGALVHFAKRVTKPPEWRFVRKLLLSILLMLTAFYMFVVGWNTILFLAILA